MIGKTDETKVAAPEGEAVLLEVEARFVKLDKIGVVPEGERINAHYWGEGSGIIGVGKLRGIDYSLKRADGTIEMHVHEVFFDGDDHLFSLERQGIARPDQDQKLSLSGVGAARTSKQSHAWLNNTPLRWEGVVDRASGRLSLKMFVPQSAINHR